MSPCATAALPTPPASRRASTTPYGVASVLQNEHLNPNRQRTLPNEILCTIVQRAMTQPCVYTNYNIENQDVGVTYRTRTKVLSMSTTTTATRLLHVRSRAIVREVLRAVHRSVVAHPSGIATLTEAHALPTSLSIIGERRTPTRLIFHPYTFETFGNRTVSIDAPPSPLSSTSSSTSPTSPDHEIAWHSNTHFRAGALAAAIHLYSRDIDHEVDKNQSIHASSSCIRTMDTACRLLQTHVFAGYQTEHKVELIPSSGEERSNVSSRDSIIVARHDRTPHIDTTQVLRALISAMHFLVVEAPDNDIEYNGISSDTANLLYMISTDVISQAGGFTKRNVSTLFFRNARVAAISRSTNRRSNITYDTKRAVSPLHTADIVALENISCAENRDLGNELLLRRTECMLDAVIFKANELRALSLAGSCVRQSLINKFVEVSNNEPREEVVFHELVYLDLSHTFSPSCCSEKCNEPFTLFHDTQSLKQQAERLLECVLFVGCENHTIEKDIPRFPKLALLVLLECPLLSTQFLTHIQKRLNVCLDRPALIAYSIEDFGSLDCQDLCKVVPCELKEA